LSPIRFALRDAHAAWRRRESFAGGAGLLERIVGRFLKIHQYVKTSTTYWDIVYPARTVPTSLRSLMDVSSRCAVNSFKKCLIQPTI
jgi:hypothetical protein